VEPKSTGRYAQSTCRAELRSCTSSLAGSCARSLLQLSMAETVSSDLTCSDGPTTPWVYYDGGVPLARVLEELDAPVRRPVLVVIGWAASPLGSDTEDAINVLMRSVVAPVCCDERAAIVTGGTDAGIISSLGKALAAIAPEVCLIGVAPKSKLKGGSANEFDKDAAAPEPNHRIICTPGNAWGDEAATLVHVAEHIAAGRGVVVLAIGGGRGAEREIAYAARRSWPVILLTGHGGASHNAASEIGTDVFGGTVTPVIAPRSPTTVESPDDVATRERDHRASQMARMDGYHIAIPLGAHSAIERALRWRLSDDAVLKDAWSRFATADKIAGEHKRPTNGMAFAVLVLATLTVLCAVGASLFRDRPWSVASVCLKILATAFPLMAAIILGLVERRSRAGSWIDIRTAAEYIIREIYRYRARAATYAHQAAPRAVFAEALATVDTATHGRSLAPFTGQAGASGIWPPTSLWMRIDNCDSLVGPLSASTYDRARVLDQLEHFQERAGDLDRKATLVAVAVFGLAGIAAFFLGISWRWPGLAALAAVFAALAAAFVSWREYKQRDARTDAMLSTCVALRSARGRWLALPVGVRENPDRLSIFVGEVEDALAAESADWERGLRRAYQNFAGRYGR
jgi:hypothetical protein